MEQKCKGLLGYFLTELFEPSENRLRSRSATNEGCLFRGSLEFIVQALLFSQGAVFEMFLKSAGSYENAKETERDILTCNENGFAQTKDMPYGIYTVKQTSGWEGRELMKPFDVFINKDGQTLPYQQRKL